MTINMNNEKNWKISDTEKELIIILIFFTKDCDYKRIGLITTISKYDIWNRKLITVDWGGQIWNKLYEWKKNEGIAVCRKDFAIP